MRCTRRAVLSARTGHSRTRFTQGDGSSAFLQSLPLCAKLCSTMKPFAAEDLFHHRVLSGLDGSFRHRNLAFKMSRALRDSDDYEGTVWILDFGGGLEVRPKRLTSAAFGAASPSLSPDGTMLAFLSTRGDDGRQLHLLRLDGGEARQLTHSGDCKLSSIEQWATAGDKLLALCTVAHREDGERDGPAGHRAPQVARFLPYKKDGSGITVGERTHLYAIDARSGGLAALTAGDFDVSAGAWSPDGSRLAFLRNRSERQRHRTDVWIARADGADARRIVDAVPTIGAFAWSPDGTRLALTGTREAGDSMAGLWVVDADGGGLRRLGGEDFEIDPAGGVHWHADGTRVVVVAMRRGLQELAAVRVADGEVAHFRAGLRHVIGMAPCGDRIAFIAASMRKPCELFSCDWRGGDERRHSAFNRAWFAKRLRPHVSRRRFRVPDGADGEETIDAWLLLPEGEGPFPLLVDMHGGPHSIALIDYAAHACWYELVSRGWAVVAPNAVGSGSYGVDFARRLCGRWGELDLPQYEAVVRALQTQGIADTRIACAGKSYGGFLAAWAIGHSTLFRAAVVCAPVANIESHAGTSDTGYYVTPYAMGGDFDQARDRYHALSPIAHCHKATAATLILQGEDDGRCPRGQSEELFAHLIRCTDAPAELVIYPKSTHTEAESGRPSNRVDYHRRTVAWLQRWTRD